ncbi:MAG: tRNA (adenosine(37)-N6)-threonylcarbamoyltransferase complex transferase subunit TsaD [Candidatus Aminicenantales bacterium]
MFVLGIETSCDETAAAVLTDDFQILSDVVLTQDEIHAPFGGVVPELASRRHLESIVYVVEESLRRAMLKLDQVDAFAVTQGPGLIGSLLVGLSFAKALAYYFKKPLIPVDHLEAHIQSALLKAGEVPYPALALVVSGGHTQAFLMKGKLDYMDVSRTRDDAAGEALDKISKFLHLGYPGGPVIERLAEKGNPDAFQFSIPRMTDGSLDFSFSGIKTEAIKKVRDSGIDRHDARLSDFLASFEQGVVRALIFNLEQAVGVYEPQSLILCGGVSRNRRLRREFQELARRKKLEFFMPQPRFSTDNGVMVAALGVEKLARHCHTSFPLSLNAYARRPSLRGKS